MMMMTATTAMMADVDGRRGQKDQEDQEHSHKITRSFGTAVGVYSIVCQVRSGINQIMCHLLYLSEGGDIRASRTIQVPYQCMTSEQPELICLCTRGKLERIHRCQTGGDVRERISQRICMEIAVRPWASPCTSSTIVLYL